MTGVEIAHIARFFDTQVESCVLNIQGCPFHQEPGGAFSAYLGCDWTCSMEVSSQKINTWRMDNFKDLDVLITQAAMGCFGEDAISSVVFHVFAA